MAVSRQSMFCKAIFILQLKEKEPLIALALTTGVWRGESGGAEKA